MTSKTPIPDRLEAEWKAEIRDAVDKHKWNQKWGRSSNLTGYILTVVKKAYRQGHVAATAGRASIPSEIVETDDKNARPWKLVPRKSELFLHSACYGALKGLMTGNPEHSFILHTERIFGQIRWYIVEGNARTHDCGEKTFNALVNAGWVVIQNHQNQDSTQTTIGYPTPEALISFAQSDNPMSAHYLETIRKILHELNTAEDDARLSPSASFWLYLCGLSGDDGFAFSITI